LRVGRVAWPGLTWPGIPASVGFANSGGVVFVNESAERACTHGCAAAFVLAVTSRPSRRRSSACTSPSEASTLRVEANNDGAPAGSPPSTPSRSPSKAESRSTSTNRVRSSYTVLQTDPAQAQAPVVADLRFPFGNSNSHASSSTKPGLRQIEFDGAFVDVREGVYMKRCLSSRIPTISSKLEPADNCVSWTTRRRPETLGQCRPLTRTLVGRTRCGDGVQKPWRERTFHSPARPWTQAPVGCNSPPPEPAGREFSWCPGREGCHYSCRVSGCGSVVLVDEAAEPVAATDLADGG
jgi:hypothetical protein